MFDVFDPIFGEKVSWLVKTAAKDCKVSLHIYQCIGPKDRAMMARYALG